MGEDEKRAVTVGVDGSGRPFFEREVEVEVMLPPVDAVAIFAIGLNYRVRLGLSGVCVRL